MIIDHIAIRVDNLDEMQEWYEKNVGAVLERRDTYYCRMKMDNTIIALIDRKRYPDNHVGVLVKEWKNLPTKGIRLTHRDGTIGVYRKDPEGNVVEYIWYPDNSEGPMKNENKRKSIRRGVFQKIYDWGFSLLD